MTTDLAVVPSSFPATLELTERDRECGPRPSPPDSGTPRRANTRRAYSSAWRQFRTWAEAGGHPALPAAPQAVALYLEVWPENHRPGFALRQADVFQSYMAQ